MSSHLPGGTEQTWAPTTEELMLRIAAGNESAFEELYDRLSPQVFGLVRRILKDQAQSEEVTQEVFVEAWQQASRYDSARGKAITWLLTLAHRRAVDRVRASQASKDRDLRQGIKEFQASYDDVEETAIQHDESRRVIQALERLSETQRDAIQLAYFGGYTHIEVAELLKIPVGTAKTRIRDGMNKLRDLMGVA
ncbi:MULTISPECIES: ECF RNA polymerase sigma factor SigK [Paeniglutamicibacter]|uniref:RNA polymerase sigma-70 factor (ECF subfamily) n=1 Tax=Paeniglutamicibacter sulfureus TaxID=43666 RepID=A0ABU2BGC5_9MICC|nr:MULTISPECIES: ECF RNA polymerase sigma factor SigK [Paeniglutamicibacter]MCV9993065.1 ECF RNA polymerase sigma factor SigK [Paeniglutamicibacter sp. ZC-3]MDO2933352.1 ECF RNA polymerase sigma factor SigK [Paeniglutamicibacter sulfureus]MDR7357663.1 RNA polymerase sigma-70 factor (ECF subfamily) [Paeniglutamicibacter sulfureus]